MPTRIELQLKATWTVRPDTHVLHGLACALFEGAGAPHARQDKPWAVGPLHPADSGAPDEWTLRAAWLPDSPPPPGVLSADSVRVGHTTCVVTQSTQRRVTHSALASGRPAGEVTVAVASPAYFSHNGSSVHRPDARLITGSWRRRWNASLAPDDSLAISDEDWRDVHRLFELGDFDLRTESRDSGHGKPRLGFVGRATLVVTRGENGTPAARTLLPALARFAEYAGTGAQVTHGFGATSLVSPR